MSPEPSGCRYSDSVKVREGGWEGRESVRVVDLVREDGERVKTSGSAFNRLPVPYLERRRKEFSFSYISQYNLYSACIFSLSLSQYI